MYPLFFSRNFTKRDVNPQSYNIGVKLMELPYFIGLYENLKNIVFLCVIQSLCTKKTIMISAYLIFAHK